MTNAANNATNAFSLTLESQTERCLMNPATGSVDTESQWLSGMTTWEGDAQDQFDSLVEVVKNSHGDWVEI